MWYPDEGYIMDAVQNWLLPIRHPLSDVRRGDGVIVSMGDDYAVIRSGRIG